MILLKKIRGLFGKRMNGNSVAAQKLVDASDLYGKKKQGVSVHVGPDISISRIVERKPQLEEIVIQDPGDWGDSLFWKSPEYHFNADYTLNISSHEAYCVFNNRIVGSYRQKGTYKIWPYKYLDRFAPPDTEFLSFCVYFARNDFRLMTPWHKEIVIHGIRSVIRLSLDGEFTLHCQYSEKVLNLALRSNLSIEEAVNQLLQEQLTAFSNKSYDPPMAWSFEAEKAQKDLEKIICEIAYDFHNVFDIVECKITQINKQTETPYSCPLCFAPLERFDGYIGYCPNHKRWVSPPERNFGELAAKRNQEEAVARLRDFLTKQEKRETSREINRISNVHFSAFSDSIVKRKHYYALRIFMYEESMKNMVELLRDAFPELNRETKTAASVPVGNGQQVTVRLSSSDAIIDEPEMTLPWEGMIREFSFAYYVPEENNKDSILITAGIYIDHVLATKLQIISDVEGEKSHLTVRRMDIQAAFMSYSSKDRQNVFKIAQGMRKARPELDLFMDVESLRSGDNWKSVIEKKICESDVLFLCWSRSAKESKWVDFEWRFAYYNKGVEFIEPIPLEPSQLCQPPEELNGKHFNDVDLLLSYADKILDEVAQSE